MNELTSFNPVGFSASSPFSVDSGLGFEYIRVINNSPYLLRIGLGGQGTFVFPEMYLEDIPLTKAYNGKITVAPYINFPTSAIAQALSSIVSINTYVAGEIVAPQSQPLTTLAAVGGGALTTGTIASQVINNGNAVVTQVVEATPSGASSSELIWNNDGSGTIGGGIETISNTGVHKWTYPVSPGTVILADWDASLTAGGHRFQLQYTTASKQIVLLDFTANEELQVWGSAAAGGVLFPQETIFLSAGLTVTAGLVKVLAPDTLSAGNQETGGVGMTTKASAISDAFSAEANFKTIMTNVPSSITITTFSTTNESGLAVTNINNNRFVMAWTAPAAGTTRVLADYTTVGN